MDIFMSSLHGIREKATAYSYNL
ncbi:protein of unknown function [Hyphomicrobium sp. MC1]|nr:protein of unknown function [Hyphomicrobium sp. MC1]